MNRWLWRGVICDPEGERQAGKFQFRKPEMYSAPWVNHPPTHIHTPPIHSFDCWISPGISTLLVFHVAAHSRYRICFSSFSVLFRFLIRSSGTVGSTLFRDSSVYKGNTSVKWRVQLRIGPRNGRLCPRILLFPLLVTSVHLTTQSQEIQQVSFFYRNKSSLSKKEKSNMIHFLLHHTAFYRQPQCLFNTSGKFLTRNWTWTWC